MRQLLLHGLLPLFAVLGAFVALSTAEPQDPRGEEVVARVALEVERDREPLPGVAAAPRPGAIAFPELPELELVVTEGIIEEGSTLIRVLTGNGVSSGLVALITSEMAPHFDFRHARPGHSFRLTRDDRGELVDFRYRVSDTSSYRMARSQDGYEVGREEALLVPRSTRIAGVVTSTLYQAVTSLGEHGQLARDFADVFAWDIDFQRSVQRGDTFEVLYERLFRVEDDDSERYMRPGRILAARYEGTAGLHTAIYFEPEQGRGGYYRPDGTSVQGTFLMAPLRHARVSSSYSNARRHPILKVVRPHHGIDYAAPLGTPVWAVSEGEVIYRARAGGFGNLVKIKHTSGYVSYYAHLSRFSKDLKVGHHVSQKQVIGYVGSTGLSTGPHICFRIAKNGHYVNPARLRTPAGEPVSEPQLASFRATAALLLSELRGETRIATEHSL